MDYFKSYGIEVGQGKYFDEAFYGVAILYNLLYNEIFSYLDQYDLTPAKFNILITIKNQGKDKGINQVELSKRLIVSPSNMTRMLDRLEREKLVVRTAQEDDRRVKVIKITERGIKLIDTVWAGYQECLNKITTQLKDGDVKMLAEGVKKWVTQLAN